MAASKGLLKQNWLSRVEEYGLIHHICFGAGATERLGEIAKGIASNRNAIIVTDKVLVDLGVIDTAKKSLKEAGFVIDVCGSEGVEPVIEEVSRVIDVVRAKDYGLVVGIGGGSAMDRAKAAAAMAETPGDLEEYLVPSEKPLEGSLPKILLPTTSGTGSECSSAIVVIVPHAEQKAVKTFILSDMLFADVAVVDPTLVKGCPPRVTAGSGMDALAHTAEGVICLHANPFSDALALKAVELVSKNLKAAVKDGSNLEARANMSWAASMGGMVCTFPWIGGPATLAHIGSESISAKYGFPHGESCGLLLPFTYWFNLPDAYARGKMALIAQAMGEDIAGLTSKAAAEKAITATFSLLEEVGLPTSLKEYNIPRSDLHSLAQFVLDRAENVYGVADFNPVGVNFNNITEFFQKAYEGRAAIGL